MVLVYRRYRTEVEGDRGLLTLLTPPPNTIIAARATY